MAYEHLPLGLTVVCAADTRGCLDIKAGQQGFFEGRSMRSVPTTLYHHFLKGVQTWEANVRYRNLNWPCQEARYIGDSRAYDSKSKEKIHRQSLGCKVTTVIFTMEK